MDDGSSDRTGAAAVDLGVACIRQDNAGPAAARNRGIRETASDYVAFLDVDDAWPPGSLDYLVAMLERDGGLDVALGQVRCFVPDEAGEYCEQGPPFATFLLGAAVYRRAVFERVGMLDESLREGEDVDWFMRAREAGVGMRVHPRTTLHYRRRAGSITFGRGEEPRTLARMLKRSIDRRKARMSGEDVVRGSLPPLASAPPAPTVAVSVIVVVRNGERFLAEAFDSIVGGTVVPDEIVVIDGGSTDRTAAIASRYPTVRRIEQVGRGIADAYNEGIRAARNVVVAFLSHDDRWAARKLELQLAILESNAACDCVVAQVQHFLEPGETPPAGFRSELLSSRPRAFIMETLLARRRAFEKVGLFDLSYRVAEDVDWFARARDVGVRIDVVDEVLLYKRVHGGNSSLTARDNDQLLLRAVRASVARKRATPKD